MLALFCLNAVSGVCNRSWATKAPADLWFTTIASWAGHQPRGPAAPTDRLMSYIMSFPSTSLAQGFQSDQMHWELKAPGGCSKPVWTNRDIYFTPQNLCARRCLEKWAVNLVVLFAAKKEQVWDHLSLWRELFQFKWKCLCFLPGHTPLWHTLQSGRSLGHGHTCRTHRLNPSTFHPGTVQSHCLSSFRQETHIPHSICHDAEPFSDPEETERIVGEG